MRELFIAFCLGWAGGALAQWLYFSKSKLIRNREEWYKAKNGD